MQGSVALGSSAMTGSSVLLRQPHHQRQQSHIGATRQFRVVARSAGGRGGGGRGAGRGNPARQPQSRPPPSSSSSSPGKPAPPPLPETGYFAPADTKAPVYAPLAGRETGDFSKRGGRWNPEFIWNTNWVEQLDYQEKLKEDRKADQAKKEAEQSTGALSLTRMADLDSMDMDLSQKLAKKKQPTSYSLNMGIVTKKKKGPQGRPVTKEVYAPPSQGEARRWARSGRFAKKVVKVVTSDEDVAAAEAEREAEQERYDNLKKDLQMLNFGTTAALFAATFAFYPVDTAYSYLFGALGGAQYLNMLNRSVESYGSENAMGGVAGQQRTLIPVILALGFNRFNELASDQTGVTLQLLPILVGFFTYKISVITKSSLALFKDLSTNYGADLPAAEESEGAAEDDAELRAEADYRDKIMRG